MVGDRELLAFRQGYYELLVSLFWREPPGDLLQHLSDGMSERIQAARNLHTLLGEGWEGIQRFLAETPSKELAETVADEYTRLFIGPHDTQVYPYESFYLTGRLLDRPLANLKTRLKGIGIEKQEGYPEPEDFLAFELEVMRWLTEKQKATTRPEEETPWVRCQADFLKEHLLVWVPTCAQDIEKAEGANFYCATALILQGLVEMERAFFREWGTDKVIPLEEARRRYGAMPTWKGPTFEMAGDEPEASLPPKNK